MFWDRNDAQFPTQFYIGALLERGVRVLLYVGANDLVCNWVSLWTARVCCRIQAQKLTNVVWGGVARERRDVARA